jgi:hypothetical protein
MDNHKPNIHGLQRQISKLRKENQRQSKIQLRVAHYWGAMTLFISIAISFLAISFSLKGNGDIVNANIYYDSFFAIILGICIFAIITTIWYFRSKK